MVSFYAFMEIFVDTVTALTTCIEYIFFFKKGHLNRKGGCPDTLDTPGSVTVEVHYLPFHSVLL